MNNFLYFPSIWSFLSLFDLERFRYQALLAPFMMGGEVGYFAEVRGKSDFRLLRSYSRFEPFWYVSDDELALIDDALRVSVDDIPSYELVRFRGKGGQYSA